jgi:preprotein translocase subunit SecE
MGVRISLPVLVAATRLVAPYISITNENMNKISNYFRDSYKELTEKVTWPNWAQLQQSTMIVLVATLVITALVSLMDFLAGGALKLIYNQLFN